MLVEIGLVLNLIEKHMQEARIRYDAACQEQGVVEYAWQRMAALRSLRRDLGRAIEDAGMKVERMQIRYGVMMDKEVTLDIPYKGISPTHEEIVKATKRYDPNAIQIHGYKFVDVEEEDDEGVLVGMA